MISLQQFRLECDFKETKMYCGTSTRTVLTHKPTGHWNLSIRPTSNIDNNEISDKMINDLHNEVKKEEVKHENNMTIEYKILTDTPEDLQKLVQEHLNDGWKLQGGPFGTNATQFVGDKDCSGVTHTFCNCQKITIIGQAITKENHEN